MLTLPKPLLTAIETERQRIRFDLDWKGIGGFSLIVKGIDNPGDRQKYLRELPRLKYNHGGGSLLFSVFDFLVLSLMTDG